MSASKRNVKAEKGEGNVYQINEDPEQYPDEKTKTKPKGNAYRINGSARKTQSSGKNKQPG